MELHLLLPHSLPFSHFSHQPSTPPSPQMSQTVELALYANALSFAFAAFTIWGLHEIPKGAAAKHSAETGIIKALLEGWKSVSSSKLIRGLIVGMVGAFVAAGAVIGLARTFVGDLGGGVSCLRCSLRCSLHRSCTRNRTWPKGLRAIFSPPTFRRSANN